MGLKDKIRRLTRMAEREMMVFELEDGTTARFYKDEYISCFLHEHDRGCRHYFGEDPGLAHPMIEALRKVSDEEMARILSQHGTLVGMMVGEDQIMRGERERLGPPVRETSPGVYE